MFTVFPSKSFNAEFIKIISPLENIKTKKINYFQLFKSIKEMYDYKYKSTLVIKLRTRKLI